MGSTRRILVHNSFVQILESCAPRGDKTLRSLVEDKLRILASTDDLRRYTTHLRQERAERLYGRFLHIDLGKGGRRLFCLNWPATTTAGGRMEILLPFFITSDRDEVDYSDMGRYIPYADCVCAAFEEGRKQEFQVWFHDGKKMVSKALPEWPFVTKR